MTAHILPGPTLAEALPELSRLTFPCCNTTRVVSSPAAAESARALHECEVAS